MEFGLMKQVQLEVVGKNRAGLPVVGSSDDCLSGAVILSASSQQSNIRYHPHCRVSIYMEMVRLTYVPPGNAFPGEIS